MRHWWWDGMYQDTQKFIRNCPQCAVFSEGRRCHRPPLHPIPVSQPFQIVGVDKMVLPKTDKGNRYICAGFPGFPNKVGPGIPIA